MGFLSSFELAELSWSIINLISEAGVASQFFNVGDEKTVLINGVSYDFVILGFDHDDLTSGGKAGITFGMKNLLAGTYAMNSLKTNGGGWNGCDMRNTNMATFFGQLPSDLQSAIKEVNKKATAGNQSSTIVTSEDKLFLFSEVEIDGIADEGYKDEGSQYDYYKSASTIKNLSNGSGSTDLWWLRSPHISNSCYFQCFTKVGGIYFIEANFTRGVCFGFCV